MTALPLFDAVASEGAPAAPGAGIDPQRLARFAARLVDSSLADLERVREYEQQFGSPDIHSNSAVEILSSVYRLYEQWEAEAGQILARVRALVFAGQDVARAGELEDSWARVRARLALSPQKMAQAIEQVRQGGLVPAETVRNELRARLRA